MIATQTARRPLMLTCYSLKRSGAKRNLLRRTQRFEAFIAKFPQARVCEHGKMAMAANLESMGKSDEALAMYQQIASTYPNSYNAPLAMLSQVYILKGKNRNDEARRICETILTQYRTSFWAGEAMQELRLLKPITTSTPPPAAVPTIPPMLAVPAAPAPKLPPRQTSRRARRRQRSRRAQGASAGAPGTHDDGRLGDPSLPLAGRQGLVLTFRELEPFPRAGLSGLFSLFHARIATKQALGFERPS